MGESLHFVFGTWIEHGSCQPADDKLPPKGAWPESHDPFYLYKQLQLITWKRERETQYFKKRQLWLVTTST